jgi:hypothetical protein
MNNNNNNKDIHRKTGLKRETHLTDRNKHWLRAKGWKKIYQDNGSQNKPYLHQIK